MYDRYDEEIYKTEYVGESYDKGNEFNGPSEEMKIAKGELRSQNNGQNKCLNGTRGNVKG